MTRETLFDMHAYCRPHGSKSERRFIRRFLSPLDCRVDGCGNLIKQVGTSNVLWSCHTDTVHRDGGMQALQLDRDQLGTVNRNCLGSDDTAGVWLMTEMIKAKKPGRYVFHRGEECGAIGSNWIVKNTPELLTDIDVAIALDRHGTSDVITHQFGRCASTAFAQSLADQLGGTYKPCSTGVFTDTANYTDLVSECTNLSVGYDYEHSKAETLDVPFVLGLFDRLMAVDTAKLVIERDPKAPTKYDYDYGDDDYWHPAKKFGRYPGQAVLYGYGSNHTDDYLDRLSMAEICLEYPDEVVDYLESLGIDRFELRRAVRDARR
jgi:hypothetical protein